MHCKLDLAATVLYIMLDIAELNGIQVTEKCLYFGVRRISARVPLSGIRFVGVVSRLNG